jgi:transcriptional regulator with PAS, ATPase and Fis domain
MYSVLETFVTTPLCAKMAPPVREPMNKKSSKKQTVDTVSLVARETPGLAQAVPSTPVGCLIYLSSDRFGDPDQSVQLEKGAIVIGRGKDCDLMLESDSISRQHVRLTVQPDGILVEDLGSTNGTTYLGKKIKSIVLQIGSTFKAGDCDISLLPLTGSRSIPVSEKDSYGDLVGISLPMRRLYSLLEMMEKSDAPVLIEGETGTGKELAARALHDNGERSGKPFVVIDCSAIPAQLMDSEMFGHRKGAFTGAVADRTGVFEAASSGTVFLDEIDDLPLELQPKLLRVLESHQIRRVGDVDYVPVDVRVVAATKRDLSEAVERGRFREDLYYRIAVIRIPMPTLRDRREDIPLLARHLAGSLSGGMVDHLDPEIEELFLHSDWPGNVRELRNSVQRMLALGTLETTSGSSAGGIRKKKPEAKISSDVSYRKAKGNALRDFNRAYLADLMSRFGGNITRAAEAAGISRPYLRTLLKQCGLY